MSFFPSPMEIRLLSPRLRQPRATRVQQRLRSMQRFTWLPANRMGSGDLDSVLVDTAPVDTAGLHRDTRYFPGLGPLLLGGRTSSAVRGGVESTSGRRIRL